MQNLASKCLLIAGVTTMVGMAAFKINASSHREAPLIATMPQVDGTDFYMFRSYEPGREAFVTLLANYIPLQAPYGGPNYFDLNDRAVYEIHIDNDGDAVEDLTFQFDIDSTLNDIQLDIDGEQVSVPLKNIGGIGPGANDIGNLNASQSYTLAVIDNDRRRGRREFATNLVDGSREFRKPADNIGNKSIPDYAAYAADHVYDIEIPGCGAGRVFVGQRKEGFAVNLGEVFDLVNTNPLGPVDGEGNDLDDANVTSFALEVPIDCLARGGDPVVGAWTTSSIRQVRLINPSPRFGLDKPAQLEFGALTQVSRLGMPLVNEVVIGLKDKDRFNASEPKSDAQFLTYVTNPTLPALLEILFFDAGARAPQMFPRTDLVAAFLTGLDGLNQPAGVVPAEMLRLNTLIAPAVAASQSELGALGGDLAGFPNGRRPGDDVVDIALRVVMGALIADPAVAPNNTAPFTDGALVDASMFDSSFPYLLTPLAGSPAP